MGRRLSERQGGMELKEVLIKRRSVRKFTEEPVSEEMIEEFWQEYYKQMEDFENGGGLSEGSGI